MSERMLKAVKHIYPDVSTIVISEDGTVKELSDGYTIPTDKQLSDALDVVDFADTMAAFQESIEEHIESTAHAWRYSSSVSLASYYNSTVEEYHSAARIFVPWRDKVWVYAFSELDKVRSGEREHPSIEDFIKELPKINNAP